MLTRPKLNRQRQSAAGGMSLIAEINLRAVNRLLLVAAIVLAVVAGRRIHTLSPAAPPVAVVAERDTVPAREVREFADVSAYIEQVSRKNIFQLRSLDPVVEHREPEDAQRRRHEALLQDLRQRLVVVGVSWRVPRMVMLYDRRHNRVYFVQESEGIGDTGATVRDISRGEVTIGIEDQEIIL